MNKLTFSLYTVISVLLLKLPLYAQTLTPLTATSNYICIGTNNKNQLGQFTKTGYKIVSSGAAKDVIEDERREYTNDIDPLKDIRSEISKGKDPKKGSKTKVNKILKSIGIAKLDGNLETKLAVLDQAVSTVKGLVLLKKQEFQALKDCIANKTNPNLPAGSLNPQVIVVRYPSGEGIAVFAAVVSDIRILSKGAGAYCAKESASPGFEINLTSNPCPSGLGPTFCEGILGEYKVGRSIGGGAIYSSPPGEAVIQSLVGQVQSEFGTKVYQIRDGEAGKTCSQVFGDS